MQLQAIPMLVNFMANHTLVRVRAIHHFFVHVHFMGVQISGVQKAFTAKFTIKRFQTGMVVFVLLEMLQNGERLFARVTPIFHHVLVIGHVVGDLVDVHCGQIAHQTLEKTQRVVHPQVNHVIEDFFGGMITNITVVVVVVGFHVVPETSR